MVLIQTGLFILNVWQECKGVQEGWCYKRRKVWGLDEAGF